MTPPLIIRPSIATDLPDLTRIYGHAVAHGTGTFELDIPDEAEMSRRRGDVLAPPGALLDHQRSGDAEARVEEAVEAHPRRRGEYGSF